MNRIQNPNVVVLITRGTPSQRAEEPHIMTELDIFKAKGIKLITIGTGIIARHLSPFLNDITEMKDNVFVARYSKLRQISRKVLDTICNDVPSISNAGGKIIHILILLYNDQTSFGSFFS